MDLLKDIPFVEKLSFMLPPMGQAALGIEIVNGNPLVHDIAMSLNDEKSFLCTKLERDFVSAIGAGCSAPVAVNATLDNNIVTIKAMIGYPNGTHIMEHSLEAQLEDNKNLGFDLAKEMINGGALEILSEAEKMAFKEEMPQRL